ncbi:hypothetical protein [Azonexus hydrophilus]|uniref:TonB C-terminal domain-containing protein n=1 Tax=Azonexus hydrophilus TaxID=418702 RepID=A0ABZ2XPB4_9RHOO
MKSSIPFLLSLVLHVTLITGWQVEALKIAKSPETIEIRIDAQFRKDVQELPAPPPAERDKPEVPTPSPRENKAVMASAAPAAVSAGTPASLAAPAPPSAEEWQLASTYKLKNSKRYRHNWGQQVRSMMGTAVEGPEQGMVRFRIEIAPDGTLANATELWSTSKTASERAWKAIKSLPPLPPTPTGKPLIFERTISFMPYETGWPPSYTLDCLPDPPAFRNPFAWDGKSPPSPSPRQTPEAQPPAADEEAVKCVTDSTAETIEQEEGEMKRQVEVYRWGR